MTIAGLQKLSMVDYPGALCCTVFLSGCQLRCPYCHNAALIPFGAEEAISEDEFFAFLDKRKKVLTAVTVSGGEPLLTAGLDGFLRRIKAAGYLVKLDTNGLLPNKLQALLQENLIDYVAMDLKATPNKYAAAVGLPIDMDKIRASIALLMRGGIAYEFRTTAVKGLHEPQDFAEIAEMIAGARAYYIQKFVDSGAIHTQGLQPLSDEEMQQSLRFAQKYIANAHLRGL